VYWLDSNTPNGCKTFLPTEESIAWIDASDFIPYSPPKKNELLTDDTAAQQQFLWLAKLFQIPLEQRHLPWQPLALDYEIIPHLFAAAAASTTTVTAAIETKRSYSSCPVIVHSPKMPMVHQRIGVYWEMDDEWYPATVSKIQNDDFYFIDYDDGESEWLPLAEHRFRFIDKDNDTEEHNDDIGMENPDEEDDNDAEFEWSERFMESEQSTPASKKKVPSHTSKKKTSKKQVYKKKTKKKHSSSPSSVAPKHKYHFPPDRRTPDGCILPKYTPERDSKGFYKKPKGRIPLGYQWNRRKGIWVQWNPSDVEEESPTTTTSPSPRVPYAPVQQQQQSTHDKDAAENHILNGTPLLPMEPSSTMKNRHQHPRTIDLSLESKENFPPEENHNPQSKHLQPLHPSFPMQQRPISNMESSNKNIAEENRFMTQPEPEITRVPFAITSISDSDQTQTNKNSSQVDSVIQGEAQVTAANRFTTQPRPGRTLVSLAFTSSNSQQMQPMEITSKDEQVIQAEVTAKNHFTTRRSPGTTLVSQTFTPFDSQQIQPMKIASATSQHCMHTEEIAVAPSISSTDKRMQIEVSIGKHLMDSLAQHLPITSESSSDHVQKCHRLLDNLCRLDMPYSSLKLDLAKPIRSLGTHSVLGDASKALIEKWQYFYVRDDLIGDWKRALQQGDSESAMGKAKLLRLYLERKRPQPQESLQWMRDFMVEHGVRQVIDDTWELLESQNKTCDALECLEVMLNGDDAFDDFV
jgi:hypothetical protein